MKILKTLSITLVVFLVAAGATALLPGNQTPDSKQASHEDFNELIFFAVLEGLYRDGVANDDVDIVLKKVKNDQGLEGYVHFIYGCPICIPAINAFRCYRTRPIFEGYKLESDTFGSGLAEAERNGLRSDDVEVRLDSLQTLIDRWVRQRLDTKRLDQEERRYYEQGLAGRREKAMAILESQRDTGSSVFGGSDCAICDGAVEGSKD